MRVRTTEVEEVELRMDEKNKKLFFCKVPKYYRYKFAFRTGGEIKAEMDFG